MHMRIAFFSPLNPLKSGISDYSEELLPYLNKHMDIDLFVDGYVPSNKAICSNFKICSHSDFAANNSRNGYNAVIYHIGNDVRFHSGIYEMALKHKGIVVLHDLSIHGLIAEMTIARGNIKGYVDEMYYNHGDEGVRLAQMVIHKEIPLPWDAEPDRYPLSRRIVETSEAVIVHSGFCKSRILQWQPVVRKIPHFCADIANIANIANTTSTANGKDIDNQSEYKKQLGLPPEKLLIGLFGYIAPPKRADVALHVFKKLKEEGVDFMICLAGDIVQGYEIRKLIRELGLEADVVITGYLPVDVFKSYIKASDICVNLRYPLHGETSGSLMRIIGMGRPVIVSNTGPFTEFPDSIARKIDVDRNEKTNLYKALKELIMNRDLRFRMSADAIEYASDKFSLDRIAKEYYDFTKYVADRRKLAGNAALKKLVDVISQEIYESGCEPGQELEPDDYDYLVDIVSKHLNG